MKGRLLAPGTCRFLPGLGLEMLVVLLCGPVHGASDLFVYTSAGQPPTDWLNRTNWSQNGASPAARLPGADDTDRVVVANANPVAAGGIRVGTLAMTNAGITGGQFVIVSNLYLAGASFTLASLQITPGATLTADANANNGLTACLVENDGVASVQHLSLGAQGTNFTVFQNLGRTTLTNGTVLTGGSIFSNSGHLLKVAGTGLANVSSIQFSNVANGLVECVDGTLLFSEVGVPQFFSSGPFLASGSNAVIELQSYNAVFTNGATCSGPGLFRLNGATVTLNGDLDAANLELASGTITGPGLLRVTNKFNWFGGAVSGVTTNSGGYFDMSPVCRLTAGTTGLFRGGQGLRRRFENYGSIVLTNTTLDTLGQAQGGPALIVNELGATLELRAPTTLNNPVILNAGTLLVLGASGSYFTITNLGLVQITSNFYVFDGYTQFAGETSVAAGATFQTSQLLDIRGGALSGSGTIYTAGGVSMGGQLRPGASPGRLTFQLTSYNYTQTVSASYEVEIGGTTPAAQYDQAAILGPATVAGALHVSFINGFAPVSGNTFEIMTFNPGAGAFGALGGLRAGNGTVLVPRYTSTNVTLVAAQEPVLSSPVRNGNQFRFNLLTTTGFSYQLEYADSLASPIQWFQLGSQFTGTGGSVTITNAPVTAPRRFYRARIQ